MRASCRRRSTTRTPIPSATSTTSPTRRVVCRSTSRSRTRWVSADTTAACWWVVSDEYAERYTSPPPEALLRLGEETKATQDAPQMSVGALEGTFLRFLVWMKQPKRVLEIGVFTGWSGIEMARGLPEGARITALDVNPETTAIAQRYAEELGVADRIDYRVGDAKQM